jgi:hypothetical protein
MGTLPNKTSGTKNRPLENAEALHVRTRKAKPEIGHMEQQRETKDEQQTTSDATTTQLTCTLLPSRFFLHETQHTNTQHIAQAALHQPLAHPNSRSMLQAVTIGNDELVES